MENEDFTSLRKEVKDILTEMNGPEKVYDFFSELGYSVEDKSYTRDKETFDFKEKENKKIKKIFTIMDFEGNLPVLLIESKNLSRGHINYITERISKNFTRSLLIFTDNYKEYTFVLPQFETEEAGEQKLKLTKLHFDIENLFYSDIYTLANIYLDKGKGWREIWNDWKDAFSIEKVTKKFFEDYKEYFFQIREEVLEQDIDVQDAHDFTLQLMSRLMFIYFVDKKGWLEGNQKTYMHWLWEKYRKQGNLGDEESNFYNEWLKILFHRAFNNKFTGSNSKLPEKLRESFINAPYLNGDLFREDELSRLDIEIEDKTMKKLIENFYEKYNFTIKEDSPVEKEVAVDPQMIGYVYESLSNVAEELEDLDKDPRKEFGIFYTQKEEVYFMVKRSIVEFLNNHTDVSKEKLYKLLFSETDEEKKEIRKEISEREFEEIKFALNDLKAVDPACGSGAFLVGLIDVLANLYNEAAKKEGNEINLFEKKKAIIQESIYGVDVKGWAISAAELRLFLQLLIETDIPKEEIQRKALLPNLRANLRVGDSLVQDIDGIFFDLRETELDGLTKSHMEEIKNEKSKFFEDRSKSKYDGVADIKKDEIKFFKRAIDDKISELEDRLGQKKEKQKTLDNGEVEPSKEEKKKIKKQRKETKKRKKKLESLKSEIAQDKTKTPMLWEVTFAEVFSNNNGFDIVIGNPPYVRQEDIKPPNMNPEEVTKEDKKEYKNKLIESVQNRIPQVQKISKRSDEYIYFYFHGLSLLNDEGTFCFITSNSWLDVKYGKELQEFLCKYAPIKAIYNNKAKRSFEHSDINTVISLFGAPNFKSKTIQGLTIPANTWPETDHNAHFVTFKKPYREVISAENMISLEKAQHYDKEIQLNRSTFKLYNTLDLRSVKITQGNLLEDGWDYPENYDGKPFQKGKYKSNKWGGKFLRAPDIYFKIMRKGSEKMAELGKIAEVRFGIKTGANKFFYVHDVTDEEGISSSDIENYSKSLEKLDTDQLRVIKSSLLDEEKYFVIEEKYLRDVARTPRELDNFRVENNNLEYRLFYPDEEASKGNYASDYIEFGEKNEQHKKSTTSSRNPWYVLPEQEVSDNLSMMSMNDRHPFWKNKEVLADARLYTINSNQGDLSNSLNTTLTPLFIELYGRGNLGQGALDFKVYETEMIHTLKPKHLPKKFIIEEREVQSIFDEIGIDQDKPIRDQEPDPLPDKKELDDIVFDALDLSEEERKEVYWAVAELVKARLEKAKSV